LPGAVGLLSIVLLACFCARLARAQDPQAEAADADIGLESESDVEEIPVADFDAELEADVDVQPTGGVEEITILGAATQTVGQDAATSAVDFDAEELLDLGVQDIRDLSAYTPNLSIKTAFAAVNPTIFVRGVGLDDFNANSASAVSVYMDGVYMYSPAGQLFGLFDVASVDVLRGPQPTLTNASAGAILIRSIRPTDDFEAYLTTSLGTSDNSGTLAGYNERTFQGALNVPLIPEVMAFRGAFKVRTRDGTTENACAPRVERARGVTDPIERNQILGTACVQATGESRIQGSLTEPTSLEDRVNNVDNWAARALLSFNLQLPDGNEIDWLLNVNGGQNKSLATQYQHTGLTLGLPFDDDGDPDTPLKSGPQRTRLPSGGLASDQAGYTEQFTEGNNFAGEYDRAGPEELDLLNASLTGIWDVTDSIEVESISAYVWHDRKTYANDDGGPRIWFDNDYTDESTALSQELSLRWLFGDENDATVGGTFLYEDLEGRNIFRNRRFRIGDGFFAFDQEFEQRTVQWGLFGQLHFVLPAVSWAPLLENFNLDGELRYNWAEKDFSQASLAIRDVGGFPANVGAESDVWTAVTGGIGLTYHITEEANVYVKYTHGWKPGHFNLGTLTSGEALTAVEPETVDSLEVGLRTEWFDGMLTGNLTYFRYKYDNLQVFQTTVDARGTVLRRLINAEAASIQGVEFDTRVAPIDDLELGVNGAWLDSQYDDFGTTFQRNRRIPGGDPPVQTFEVSQDYSGNRLIASPVWSFTFNASYRIELGRYGALRPWYISAYTDDIFFGPNEGFGGEGTLEEGLLREPGYWIHNAGITYTTPSDLIEVGVWMRNFLNEEYRIQSFDFGNPNRFLIDVYGDPRTAGLTVTVRF